MNELPSPEQIRAEFAGQRKTVVDLLAYFGYSYRTYECVPVIESALRSADLTTKPSFALCPHNQEMEFKDLDDSTPILETTDELDEDAPIGSMPQRPFLVRDIPSAQGEFQKVTSDFTFAQAVSIMRSDGIDQLPVIDGASHLRGVLTWKSVARRLESHSTAPLSASLEAGHTASLDDRLFDKHLLTICEHGYVLVRDQMGKLCGKITLADLSMRFHEVTRPYFMVGEVELRLRKLLGTCLDPTAIMDVQPNNRKTGKIDDLQFGQYISLLANKEMTKNGSPNADQNWAALNRPTLDRLIFLNLLESVRKIRNSVAHFHTAPVTDSDLKEVERLSGLLGSAE
ncbi:CBS domain-containing protein [Nocardia sp. NPDC051981]|uniref:CBS domain-containing protein n=1 Tax=Nocardia sp. NPDC051981 TaxID=3155417 RepID=UPI0034222399